MLAIAAIDLHDGAGCAATPIVATVMSNLGLRRALAAHGIDSSRRRSATATCSQALEERDLVLGGEQSGHVIFRELADTGDGTARPGSCCST